MLVRTAIAAIALCSLPRATAAQNIAIPRSPGPFAISTSSKAQNPLSSPVIRHYHASCADETPSANARFAIRAGFYLGTGFTDGLLHTHLEGFEIGADVPIARHVRGLNGIYFSPTIVFGGSNRGGADTDGNIYRLMVNVKRDFGSGGFYAGLGAGIGFTQARTFTGAGAAAGRPNDNSEFADVTGFNAQLLAGYVFDYRGAARTKPFVEISYFAGSEEKLNGFSFDAGLRF